MQTTKKFDDYLKKRLSTKQIAFLRKQVKKMYDKELENIKKPKEP